MHFMSSDDRFRPDHRQRPEQDEGGAHPQPGLPHPPGEDQWASQPPGGHGGPPGPQPPGQEGWHAHAPQGQGQYSPQGPHQPNAHGQAQGGFTGGPNPAGPVGSYPVQQGTPGNYPPGGGYPPGGYPPGGNQKGRGRSTAIIATVLVIVLLLVGLGIWWWLSRSNSPDAADGANSPGEAATTFVERFNGEDFSEIYDSISPAEQRYASSLTTLLMRYSWEAGSDTDVDEAEAQEEIREALGRYSEAIDYSMTVDHVEEVALTDGMTAVVVTEGSIELEITDIEQFSEITGDLLESIYTEDQIRRNFGVSGTDELVADLEEELRSSGETEFSGSFSPTEPLILVAVEEEKGWYISPISSAVAYMNIDFFTDAGERDSFIRRNGDFTLAAPEPAGSPEEAAELFVDALANEPLSDSLGRLPLAEQRGLGLLIYLSEIPQIQEISVGDLISLTNLRTTTIEVSDHSALGLLDTLRIDVNPAFSGQAMQIVLEDEQVTIGRCAPIDVSLLMDEDTPLLAFALVEDESGWNVSIIGTLLNAAAAATTAEQNIGEYQLLASELESCLG